MDRWSIIKILSVIIAIKLYIHTQSAALFFITIIVGISTASICDIMKSDFNEASRSSTDISSYNRKEALIHASKFLTPYKNPNRNLRLSNSHIVVILASDGKTIKCREKNGQKRSFAVNHSNVYEQEDLWNLICWMFDEDKTYDEFNVYMKACKAQIKEDYLQDEHNIKNFSENKKNDIEERECIDVNNCSEIELKNLPGINIIMAKKIIIRREEVGGFKSIEEFIQYLKPTSAIESQLRKMVKIGSAARNIYTLKNERQIDI